MKNKVKIIIRCVAFALLVCMILIVMCDLFEQENNTNMDKRFTTYRNLNEDTVDAVYIGTSGVDRYWVAAKAYEEYGMTVYPLATDSMPTWLFENILDEIYDYQNPKLIIVDIRCLSQVNDTVDVMDVRARRVLDAMPMFSMNRIKAGFKTMESIHYLYEDEPRFNISYLLSFVKYHTKWSEDDYSIENNLGNKEHAYLGFFLNSTMSATVVAQEPVVYNPNITTEIDKLTERSYYELLDYAKEKGIELLFVDSPQFRGEEETARTNAAYQLLEETGQNYIHYYTTNEDGSFSIDLDPETDFYNPGHVNFYGAEKFTDALAEYIDENYDLPDRRNEYEVKEDWDGVYQATREKIAQYEEKLRSKG